MFYNCDLPIEDGILNIVDVEDDARSNETYEAVQGQRK